MLIEAPVEPLIADRAAGLLVMQKLGKVKMMAPLYELHFVPGDDAGLNAHLATLNLPADRLRVLPRNITIHPLTDRPVGAGFVYRPEDEAVRVRVPIRYLNEEKCPGLRSGGWLNRVMRSVDIAVAPHTRAPAFVTVDLAGLAVKGRRCMSDIMFEGDGRGCRTLLPDDAINTVISKV